MFAARADQENFVHGQQQAAASKPLNQGVRGLGAKTPGNKAPKTPFKKPLNDENYDFGGKAGGKTGKKGGDTLFAKGSQKGADLDKNAFVTPAGPRNRAPLGMKTTNAKAGFLKTPNAQPEGKSAQKTVSPRLRRAKVKIHQADTVQSQVQHVDPEIEYMAPRSVPLPDYPDDLHEQDYSMLQGANLTNGWWGTFSNPLGESTPARLARQESEMQARAAKAEEAIIARALEADVTSTFDFATASAELEAKKKRNASTFRAPSTLSSKRAAAALSRPPSSSPSSTSKPLVPRFAALTATAAARSRNSNVPHPPVSRKQSPAVTSATASPARHAVASAASKSTLGYSAGRAVSASARQPLSSSIYKNPAPSSPALSKQAELLESLIADDLELEVLLQERNRGHDGDEEKVLVGRMKSVKLGGLEEEEEEDDMEEEDELKDFQFAMPEN